MLLLLTLKAFGVRKLFLLSCGCSLLCFAWHSPCIYIPPLNRLKADSFGLHFLFPLQWSYGRRDVVTQPDSQSARPCSGPVWPASHHCGPGASSLNPKTSSRLWSHSRTHTFRVPRRTPDQWCYGHRYQSWTSTQSRYHE